MNYGVIVAGGIGSRMGKSELPKQFLILGDKPVIVHTIEQFLLSKEIDRVVVAVPKKWLIYMQDIAKKYFSKSETLWITSGGTTRNETIMNVCQFIEDTFTIQKDDIIVTHDAVRPFITQRMITENIIETKKYGAVDTVVPAYDTIVKSVDNETITEIPMRDQLYLGQTPQSFILKEFVETYQSMSESEKEVLTDATKIYVLKRKAVKLIHGEFYNIKITTPHDLRMANLMIDISEAKVGQ